MKSSVIFFSVVVAVTATELPSSFKICKKTEPHMKKCLAEAIETALIVANGNRGLKILPLEPLAIDYLLVTGTGPVAITYEYRNLKIHGLTKNIRIIVDKFDNKTYSFNMVIFIPRMDLFSDYKISGKILLLPIQGEGKSTLTLREKMNEFINENIDEIFRELKVAYEDVFREISSEISDKILNNVPLKKLFPPE
ncbi:protein takeout [Harpegnathos saltator]|uniref:protein takeout n=1 Tax=Harpegnathos saltator TaxID=610380 RepID=UPI000DBEE19E|nr:protein takeout [Harpegnathos saltator]